MLNFVIINFYLIDDFKTRNITNLIIFFFGEYYGQVK